MCGLGRLYSKQNVIEQLLEKDKMPDSVKHIKSLKDVKNLRLSPNPAYKDDDKSEGLLDTRSAPYICKLIGLEMSGKFRFVALWSCGCVFSERALKEIKATKICALCQTPFAEEDIVILNGTDEETDLMRVKMEARVARRKASKKDKSNIKEELTKLPEPANVQPSTSAIDSETVSVGKLPKNKIVVPIKRNGEDLQDPMIKKLKFDYSVARDPKATDVYKSLFTTHKSEKEQSRAHWVTYNPFYN